MSYKLFVDDNYHYMDESHRSQQGDYATLAEALQAAHEIVDRWLVANYRPGMTAEALFEGYTQYGEDPFIVPPVGEAVAFSAWDYARQRCKELAASSG